MVRRASQVVSIFARFGFAWALHELDMDGFLPRRKRAEINIATAGLEIPERLRLALEELGPTAIKLGQTLATRADMVPVAFVHELRKLQDHVPACSFNEVRKVVKEELGEEIADLFEEFEEIPRASASIGQVHFARLKSGERVAVKVQRPDVAAAIEIDVHLLMWAAKEAQKRILWAEEHNISELSHEFVRVLRDELDYTIEADKTRRLRSNLQQRENTYVPRIFAEYCTRRVLVVEWIDGSRVDDEERLREFDIDKREAARNFFRLMLQQILQDGYFHNDPHAGNVLLRPENQVVFLDCGNAVAIGQELRESLVNIMLAALSQDAQEVVDVLFTIGASSDRTDLRELELAVGRMLADYTDVRSSSQVGLGRILDELMSIVFKHGVRVPPTFTAIAKSLMVAEGLCLQLDADFDGVDVLREEARVVLREHYSPRRLFNSLVKFARSSRRYAVQIPRQVNNLLAKLDAGQIRVRIFHENLDKPLHRLDMMVNRIAFALVVSAIILSSTMIMTSTRSEAPLAAWVTGFYVIAGVVLAGWLLYSILKSGRL